MTCTVSTLKATQETQLENWRVESVQTVSAKAVELGNLPLKTPSWGIAAPTMPIF